MMKNLARKKIITDKSAEQPWVEFRLTEIDYWIQKSVTLIGCKQATAYIITCGTSHKTSARANSVLKPARLFKFFAFSFTKVADRTAKDSDYFPNISISSLDWFPNISVGIPRTTEDFRRRSEYGSTIDLKIFKLVNPDP